MIFFIAVAIFKKMYISLVLQTKLYVREMEISFGFSTLQNIKFYQKYSLQLKMFFCRRVCAHTSGGTRRDKRKAIEESRMRRLSYFSCVFYLISHLLILLISYILVSALILACTSVRTAETFSLRYSAGIKGETG